MRVLWRAVSVAGGLLIGCRIGCVELPVGHAQAVRRIATVDRLAAERTGDRVLRGIPGGDGHHTVAEGGVEPGNIIKRPIAEGCRAALPRSTR